MALDPVEPELEDQPQPFIEHIIELRRRLIYAVLFWGIGSLAVFRYSGNIIRRLAEPVGSLVFLAPTEAFYTRLKVAGFVGFILALPLILHQVYLFGARALSRKWRGLLATMVPISYFLFLLGASICVFIVVPAAMKFLLSYGGDGLKPMLGLSYYLGFITGLSLAFGGIFQLPLVLYGLNRMGVVEKVSLCAYRRHIYLLCFVIAGIITPPDPMSQISLAVPAIILFELTLLAMR